MAKLKKYKVRLEFHVKQTIEVEAKDEEAAEKEALEQCSIDAVHAEHYSTDIDEIE